MLPTASLASLPVGPKRTFKVTAGGVSANKATLQNFKAASLERDTKGDPAGERKLRNKQLGWKTSVLSYGGNDSVSHKAVSGLHSSASNWYSLEGCTFLFLVI